MMPPVLATAAVVKPEDARPLFTPDDSMPRDVLILVGVAVSIGLAAAIWVMFFRKRKGLGKRGHHEAAENPLKKLTRPRRRRREHRARNPTRAETGGLPPVRTEDSANRFG